jgi:DNA-binding MarR family transcriptional regulator
MVALIDDLQERGLVRRRQDPDDRRKNVVELTDAGQDITRRATQAGAQASGPSSARYPPTKQNSSRRPFARSSTVLPPARDDITGTAATPDMP